MLFCCRSLCACNSLSHLLCLFSLALARSAARRCSLQFRLFLSLVLSASRRCSLQLRLSLSLALSPSRRCSLQFRLLSLALARSISRSSSVALCLLFRALWRSLSLCSSVKLCLLALCRSLSSCSSFKPSPLHIVFILLSFVDITNKGFSMKFKTQHSQSFCYDKLWLIQSHEETPLSNDGRAISRQGKRRFPRRAISRQKRGTLCQVVQELLWHFTSAYMKCVYERAGVLYVITKFSRMDSLPNFVTHGAPLIYEMY